MSESAEPGLGVLLFIAYRQLEERAFDAVIASGADDITMAQARLLARIGPEGNRISELAEQARVTKQTASFLVEALETAGYVERARDPRDGRARVIRLSPKGRRLVPIGQDSVDRTIAQWAEKVGPERLSEVTSTLAEIRELADPYR